MSKEAGPLVEPKEVLELFATRVPMNEALFNPVVSMRRRYVFFPISKCANSSIKYVLRNQDAILCNIKVTNIHDRVHTPLLTPFQLGQDYYVRECLYGDYFRFAFVRNPFSRLLSCYLDRIVGRKGTRPRRQLNRFLGTSAEDDISFQTFIEAICSQESRDMNDHWRDQYTTLQCGDISLDFIGKVERLGADLAIISERVTEEGEDPLSADVNKSPQKTSAGERVKQYYDEKVADFVRQRFEKDFTVYGYSMELDRVGEP
jgi:hypothetical protein